MKLEVEKNIIFINILKIIIDKPCILIYHEINQIKSYREW